MGWRTVFCSTCAFSSDIVEAGSTTFFGKTFFASVYYVCFVYFGQKELAHAIFFIYGP